MEELLAERGVEVHHVTVFRWVQRFTPLFADAARPLRHATGDRWFVDETYVKVAGRWRYLYRAVDAVLRSAPDGREDAVSRPAPSARKRAMLAVGGAAALAATATAVLRARGRRKVTPASRIQRLALRGRAASAAVTARTGQVAAPVLGTTTQVVRQRKAGAAAATSAIATAVLAAKRRRRSQDVPDQWSRETIDD